MGNQGRLSEEQKFEQFEAEFTRQRDKARGSRVYQLGTGRGEPERPE